MLKPQPHSKPIKSSDEALPCQLAAPTMDQDAAREAECCCCPARAGTTGAGTTLPAGRRQEMLNIPPCKLAPVQLFKAVNREGKPGLNPGESPGPGGCRQSSCFDLRSVIIQECIQNFPLLLQIKTKMLLTVFSHSSPWRNRDIRQVWIFL